MLPRQREAAGGLCSERYNRSPSSLRCCVPYRGPIHHRGAPSQTVATHVGLWPECLLELRSLRTTLPLVLAVSGCPAIRSLLLVQAVIRFQLLRAIAQRKPSCSDEVNQSILGRIMSTHKPPDERLRSNAPLLLRIRCATFTTIRHSFNEFAVGWFPA